MIGLKTKTTDETAKVKKTVAKANYQNLGHAARSIRTIARRSIRDAPEGKPSPAGKPPRTRADKSGKKRLRNAILYDLVSDVEAVIGPARHLIGLAGAAHEDGGTFRGEDYPARPFMRPALEKAKSQIPKHWSNSVRNN